MDFKRLAIMFVLVMAAVLALQFLTKPADDGQAPPAESAPAETAGQEQDPPAEPSEDVAAVAEVADASAEPPAEPAPDAPADPPTDSDASKWYVLPGGAAQPEVVTIGSVASDGAYMFRVQLTSQGAGVVRAEMADHFVTVADRQLYDDSPAEYEQARQADPETYQGYYPLLESIEADGETVIAMGTRRLWVRLLDGSDRIIELKTSGLDRAIWEIVEQTETSATFACTVYRGVLSEGAHDDDRVLRLTKTFRVEPDDYTITAQLKLANLSVHDLKVMVDQAGPAGLKREGVRADDRRVGYGRIMGEDRLVQAKMDSHKDLGKRAREGGPLLGRSDESDPVVWVGTVNKYFASLLHLTSGEENKLEATRWQANFYVEPSDEADRYLTGICLGAERGPDDDRQWGLTLKADDAPMVATFELFAGPKDRSVFTDAENPLHRPIYAQLNYTSTINFGGCGFCTWTWLAFQVMALLKLFSGVLFGNYGLAIILLVFLVRLLLHPLAKKSQLSMLKMQKLGPAMAKLKEKYADDKDTLNKEMMKVYREQGATPLLGCLPMFLQMPIWIALYTGINASVQLRHAAFLPVWITDLAAPDALISWGDKLPLIGTSFNLLPILLCVAMYFQTKMTPTMAPSAGADDEKAQAQKKMMRYMMPGMMLVFFYAAPSGLTLYIMASTAAGVLDSFLIRRHIREKEALEAAQETTVSAPGKTARSARRKKPKGPNWVKGG